MPGFLQRLRFRGHGALLLWVALTLLMAAGVLHSIFILAGVPAHETLRANSQQQRVIIDPISGIVSGIKGDMAASQPFEVADAPAAEEEKKVEEVSATPSTGDAAATSTAVTEQAEAAAGAAANTPEDTAAQVDAAPNLEPLQRTAASTSIPVVTRSPLSLVAAPAPEISARDGDTILPIRGEGDARASSLYARRFTRVEQQPLVAVVVTDIGFSAAMLEQVLTLPPEISVGISPYASDAAQQIEAIRNRGHELWTMLPTMSTRYPQDDPGPRGLIAALTIKGAMARLHSIMASGMGSVGMILPPDETLSQQADIWQAVRDEIDSRGLFILSTHPTRDIGKLARDAAQRDMIGRADIVLDTSAGASAMRSKLASIAELAVAKNKLVVLVSARPQALRMLRAWIAEKPLGDMAVFAPLSAIYAPDSPPPATAPAKESGDHGGGH